MSHNACNYTLVMENGMHFVVKFSSSNRLKPLSNALIGLLALCTIQEKRLDFDFSQGKRVLMLLT